MQRLRSKHNSPPVKQTNHTDQKKITSLTSCISIKSKKVYKYWKNICKYEIPLLPLPHEILKYMTTVITYISLYTRGFKGGESLFFRFKIFLCACFSLHFFKNFMKILTKNRIFLKKVLPPTIGKTLVTNFASLRIWIIGKNNLSLMPLSACWHFG